MLQPETAHRCVVAIALPSDADTPQYGSSMGHLPTINMLNGFEARTQRWIRLIKDPVSETPQTPKPKIGPNQWGSKVLRVNPA